jgi:hypothetical protein
MNKLHVLYMALNRTWPNSMQGINKHIISCFWFQWAQVQRRCFHPILSPNERGLIVMISLIFPFSIVDRSLASCLEPKCRHRGPPFAKELRERPAWSEWIVCFHVIAKAKDVREMEWQRRDHFQHPIWSYGSNTCIERPKHSSPIWRSSDKQ